VFLLALHSCASVEVTRLLDGVTLNGSIEQGESIVYSYLVREFEVSNQLVLVASSGPDWTKTLDMFVGMNFVANSTVYTWSVIPGFAQQPSLTLTPKEGNFTTGTLYITVFGANATNSFYISATSGTIQYTFSNGLTSELNPTQHGDYSFAQFDVNFYFSRSACKFDVESSADFDVFLSFVSIRPTVDSNQWYFSALVLCFFIKADDPNWGMESTLYIGLLNKKSAASANVTVTCDLDVTSLVEGEPVDISAPFVYYTFPVTSKDTVTISTNTTGFNVYMYASFTTTRPDQQLYTWQSSHATISTKSFIKIKPSDPNFTIGTLYISTYQFNNIVFSIEATMG